MLQEGSFTEGFPDARAHLQAGKEAWDHLGLCQAACHEGHRAQHSGALRLPSALQRSDQALRACLHTTTLPPHAFY